MLWCNVRIMIKHFWMTKLTLPFHRNTFGFRHSFFSISNGFHNCLSCKVLWIAVLHPWTLLQWLNFVVPFFLCIAMSNPMVSFEFTLSSLEITCLTTHRFDCATMFSSINSFQKTVIDCLFCLIEEKGHWEWLEQKSDHQFKWQLNHKTWHFSRLEVAFSSLRWFTNLMIWILKHWVFHLNLILISCCGSN